MRASTPHGHDFFHWHGFHGLFTGHDYYDDIGFHRGWLVAVGALFLLLGLIGLAMVSVMTVATVMFFGVMAILGGIVQLAVSFTWRGQRNVMFGAVMGGLYIFAGLVMISNPLATSMVLTLLLGIALLALGGVRIYYWLQQRSHKNWVWPVVTGAISILLGLLIIAQWPVSGLWVIGLFVSLELIFFGATGLALGWEKRSVL